MCMCVHTRTLSHVQLFATLRTVAPQAPLSMGFSRQEYTEELYKKDLHNPDNHNGVMTDIEPDILECKVNGPSVQFSSVSQSCLTFCDPMVYSTLGLPVYHQLLESTQTHVH